MYININILVISLYLKHLVVNLALSMPSYCQIPKFQLLYCLKLKAVPHTVNNSFLCAYLASFSEVKEQIFTSNDKGKK